MKGGQRQTAWAYPKAPQRVPYARSRAFPSAGPNSFRGQFSGSIDECIDSPGGPSRPEIEDFVDRNKDKLHRCAKCRIFFPSREFLQQHLSSHANDSRICCLHCSEVFDSEGTYAIHKVYHVPQSVHICVNCRGRFINRLALKRHQIRCTTVPIQHSNNWAKVIGSDALPLGQQAVAAAGLRVNSFGGSDGTGALFPGDGLSNGGGIGTGATLSSPSVNNDSLGSSNSGSSPTSGSGKSVTSGTGAKAVSFGHNNTEPVNGNWQPAGDQSSLAFPFRGQESPALDQLRRLSTSLALKSHGLAKPGPQTRSVAGSQAYAKMLSPMEGACATVFHPSEPLSAVTPSFAVSRPGDKDLARPRTGPTKRQNSGSSESGRTTPYFDRLGRAVPIGADELLVSTTTCFPFGSASSSAHLKRLAGMVPLFPSPLEAESAQIAIRRIADGIMNVPPTVMISPRRASDSVFTPGLSDSDNPSSRPGSAATCEQESLLRIARYSSTDGDVFLPDPCQRPVAPLGPSSARISTGGLGRNSKRRNPSTQDLKGKKVGKVPKVNGQSDQCKNGDLVNWICTESECGQRFANADGLAEHMVVHIMEKTAAAARSRRSPFQRTSREKNNSSVESEYEFESRLEDFLEKASVSDNTRDAGSLLPHDAPLDLSSSRSESTKSDKVLKTGFPQNSDAGLASGGDGQKCGTADSGRSGSACSGGSGEETMSCPYCPRFFAKERQFNAHIATHSFA